MKKYEGMFLLDHGKVKNELQGALDEISGILEKHQGKVVEMGKWDERKLAYEIKRQKRGTYVLTHFEAPVDALDEIRRDCHLSETISRQIFLRIEGDKFPPFMTASDLDAKFGTREYRDRGPRRFSRDDRSRDDRPRGERPSGDRPGDAAKPDEKPEKAAAPAGGGDKPAGDGGTAE